MSILTNGNEENVVMVGANPTDVADRLILTTKKAYQILVNVFNQTSIMFWTNKQNFSPQQISDALGKNGKELFEIHGKLGEFLTSIDPEAIDLGLSVVGDFEFLEDGSIKITEGAPGNAPGNAPGDDPGTESATSN
jgi:hypothetical protein